MFSIITVWSIIVFNNRVFHVKIAVERARIIIKQVMNREQITIYINECLQIFIFRFLNSKFLEVLESHERVRCNKFLQNHHKNRLNLTMNYTVCVANCCKHCFYLIFTLECLVEILWNFKTYYLRPSLYSWQIHNICYRFCFSINLKKLTSI